MSTFVERLRENMGKVIKGKPDEIDLLITCFLGGGNVLLNDVPGVGKTTLARSISTSIAGAFRRIQFTPDLLPGDILGGSIYNQKEGTFELRKGPVFTNVLLADEINRASPRTQSALLEAMGESQVSIEGETHILPDPFWVIATQNPVESHGTYPLPEAQLDRFAMQLAMGYPPRKEEEQILAELNAPSPLSTLKPVTDLEEAAKERKRTQTLPVDEDVRRYIIDVVQATREEPRLALGASPRGAITLYRMAQGFAVVHGRDAVLPDDVKSVAKKTLAHRLVLETKARYSGVNKEDLVGEILERVKVPV
jgi:MoxR-like ATPase